MSLPLVSIVIPTYKPAYFEQCLRSAIGQTYPNLEILISDNCPTEAIRDICARFPGVIYQRCSVTRADNVLAALYGAKGEYVKPLFDDDILHPFCVERMVAAASIVPDIDLVFAASGVIDKDNAMVRRRVPYPQNGLIPGRELYRTITLMANVVGEFSSLMVRRQRLWELGPQRLFTMGDYDFRNGLADAVFYCRVADGRNAYYLNEELSYFRHDMRLESNSNPSTNLNFGWVLAEGYEMWRGAHMEGVISTDELLATRESGLANFQRHGEYPQVSAAYQRYCDYLAALGATPRPD
ncbi:glycosyltransferase [Pseudoduganella sp. FT26W]|uniref:Glycosyltransferase n=1 Tax=Duganella aquatilis TaxID=2666082 RepID=A0A844DA72_9BURK|nr:glycosyltransferase [Duganella aquatilis]MRW84530.1 glycosyltransferase [Duganella aquatilis]